MQIYHYHRDTLEYAGASEARVDPLEHANHVKAVHAVEKDKAEKNGRRFDPASHTVEPKHFLIPAFATAIAPPEITEGKRARFVDGAWQISDIEKPDVPEAEKADPWAAIRSRRDALLRASDWTQLADCPLTKNQKADWTKHRADLRDLPKSSFNVEKIVWPSSPGGGLGNG